MEQNRLTPKPVSPSPFKYAEKSEYASTLDTNYGSSTKTSQQIQKAMEANRTSLNEVIELAAILEKRLEPICRQDTTLKESIEAEPIRVIVSPLASDLWNLWKPMSDLKFRLSKLIESLDL